MDRAAIQQQIDFALANGEPEVVLPPGRHVLDGVPLMVRRGEGRHDVVSLTLRALSLPYGERPADCVIEQPDERVPAIIVQRGKGVAVRNVALTSGHYIGTSDVDGLLDDSAFGLGRTGDPRDNRYSPHAAVCVDPFHPSVPAADRYPGLEHLYDYADPWGSSDVEIDRCVFDGWLVGFALAPNGVSQNAENIILRACSWREVRDCVALCQSQSRAVRIDDQRAFRFRYFVAGRTYGARSGGVPAIYGGNLGHGRAVFDTTSTGQAAIVSGLYAEQVHGLGALFGGLPRDPVVLHGCNLKMPSGSRRPTAELLNYTHLSMVGCQFSRTDARGDAIRFHNGGSLAIDGCAFPANQPRATPPLAVTGYTDRVAVRNTWIAKKNPDGTRGETYVESARVDSWQSRETLGVFDVATLGGGKAYVTGLANVAADDVLESDTPIRPLPDQQQVQVRGVLGVVESVDGGGATLRLVPELHQSGSHRLRRLRAGAVQ